MLKTKQIWIVNQHAVLHDSFGSTRHLDLCQGVSNSKYHFTIISSSFNHFEKVEKASSEPIKIEKINKNIDFVWIKTSPYKTNGIKRLINAYVFSKKLKLLSNLIEKPDLIIGSSPQLLSSYESLKIARKFKIPFIFEVRDIWPDSLIDLGMNRANPLVRYFRLLEKRLMAQSDKIIAIMPKLNIYALNRFKIPRDKIVWISNGVKDESINTHICNIKRKKFIVTYSGTIGKMQDTESIINAANDLRDYPEILFHIIGDGVEKDKCIKLVKDLKLNNKVKFFEPIMKSRLIYRLRESDLLILALKNPSVYNYGCQPNKMFDYLAAGRPIICSSSSANNPLSRASCGVNIKSGSSENLAKAILKIYRSTDKEKKQMSRNAINFVYKNYRISLLSLKLKKILDDALET